MWHDSIREENAGDGRLGLRVERTAGLACTAQTHVSASGTNMPSRLYFQSRGPSHVPCIFWPISTTWAVTHPFHFLYHFTTYPVSHPLHFLYHFTMIQKGQPPRFRGTFWRLPLHWGCLYKVESYFIHFVFVPNQYLSAPLGEA